MFFIRMCGGYMDICYKLFIVCALLLFYNNSSYKRKYIRKILIFLEVNDETKIGRYKPRTDGTERTKWKPWK